MVRLHRSGQPETFGGQQDGDFGDQGIGAPAALQGDMALLVAPAAPGAVDLIRNEAGEFFVVKGAAGRDSLGMRVNVAICRWAGTPPTVRGTP